MDAITGSSPKLMPMPCFVIDHDGNGDNQDNLFPSSFKGIVHNFFVYRSNLIFWIVMGCGIADFARRGL